MDDYQGGNQNEYQDSNEDDAENCLRHPGRGLKLN